MFANAFYLSGFDVNTVPVVDHLVAWFDAADANTITESSGDVSQWDDKSGNANNASQGTASNQPLLVADAANGHPVIRFDGVDNFLSLPSVIISGSTLRTAFFVIRRADNGAAQTFFSLTTATSNIFIYGRNPVDIIGSYQISSKRDFTGSVADPTDFFVLTHVTPTTNISTSEMRIDGSNLSVQSTNAGVFNTSSSGTSSIGRWRSGNPQYFDGDLGEIIIYDKALSNSEILSVESYLAVKWGVTLA